MSDLIKQHILPNNQPILRLDCETAFNSLANKEKLYAHYLSKAAWEGSLIVLIQTSYESPLIFVLLHKIFLNETIDEFRTVAVENGITEDEFTAFLIYSCGIFANIGNYKSFGDSKIIPNLPREKFETIIKCSKAYKENEESIQKIWNKIQDVVYLLDDKSKSLGLGDGVTGYFSPNCTAEDAEIVTEFMKSKELECQNTRCFKSVEHDKENDKDINVYEIRLASIETGEDPEITVPKETFKEAKFTVTRGDYSPLLKSLVENLEKAKEYAANDTEKKMIDKYISHFKTGSLEDHKDGSRFWIKDKGPVIETYIGFIETYRDPAGQRAEFEGFVAMVNKEMSKKYSTLVAKAPELLQKLPWGKEFEKDTFLTPDFTSLDVLAYAGSDIPDAINIPNYDQIRQSEGFKNVSLGNVTSQSIKQDVLPFLSEEDQALMIKYRSQSFEIQVGLHELLGHGSGKLLKEIGPYVYNFDIKNMKNPLTGESIKKYFKTNETYDSVFKSLGSSYEECRAEAVGLYLCSEPTVLEIFGHTGEKAEDIIYVNWLSLLWTGCGKALEVYEPSKKQWLQAHSQARYVLSRVCLEAGEDFIKIEETDDGKNLRLTVDRSLIKTVGKKAIGDFLLKLQFYKSTADIEAATELYDKYSEVPESGPYPWARWRDIILAHKRPRRIFVQPNTFVDESDPENVILKNYESASSGLIQSWIERFPNADIEETLIELYEKDKKYYDLQN